MEALEKYRGKVVHFLFPIVERFYLVASLVLLVAAWFVPDTYWPLRVVLFWLWLLVTEIDSAGRMERDYLPVQPGSSIFYHIYRFVEAISLVFLLVLLAIMLIPGLMWIKEGFLGVFIIGVILRAIGDRKYRPKKPEE